MTDIKTLIRLMRIREFLNIPLISSLVFLISPQNLFTYKTIIVFLANFFLTASIFVINDVEDAEDDYHDLKKRKRNSIANGELNKKQGYLVGFSFLFLGLFLLLNISYLVFLVAIILTPVGIFYSWRLIRLKSIPVIDVISHSICLGVLQLSTMYLTFYSSALQFISLLIMIIPYSIMIEITQELRDFEVDKKTKISNTVQKFGKFNPTKFYIIVCIIMLAGYTILYKTIDRNNLFFPLSILLGILLLLNGDSFKQLSERISQFNFTQ